MVYSPSIWFLVLTVVGLIMALVVMVVVVVLVVVEGDLRVTVAIVVGMLHVLPICLVVLVYHLPVACVFSGGCGGGDNYVSDVAGCHSGSLLSQNCAI